MTIRSWRFPVLVLLTSVLLGCEESGEYQPAAARMAQQTIEMMISSGRCPTIDQCRKAELVFARPLNDGVELQIYDVDSIRNMSEIVGKDVESAYANQVPHLLIRGFRQTRDKRPYLSLDLDGADTVVVDLKIKNAAGEPGRKR